MQDTKKQGRWGMIFPVVLSILIFFLVFAFMSIYAPGPIRQALLGYSIQDFGLFGNEKGGAEYLKVEFGGRGKYQDFETIDSARAYFTANYKPDQKVMYNCLHEDGTGPYKSMTTVSQLKDISCEHGYIYTFKLWFLY